MPSKLLNYEEITQRNIFSYPQSNQIKFTNATVNLTVGKIINLEDYDEVASFKIPPRGMALVISDEMMNIPNGIVGYTTVKNGLSLRGIMAVNIGIVDNGWSGPISSILINFGSKSYELKSGDVFLRMSFHEFDIPASEAKNAALPSYSKDAYISQRKTDARAYLSDTFLVLNQVKKQIRRDVIKSFWKYIGWTGLALAIVTVVISVVVYVVDYSKAAIDYRSKLNASSEFRLINAKLDSAIEAYNDREKHYVSVIMDLKESIDRIEASDSINRLQRNDVKPLKKKAE